MGKKKKNNFRIEDIFNMSPEEQKANAERFHDLETGEVSVLDLLNCDVPTGITSQSDFLRQAEEACLRSMKEKQEPDTDTTKSIVIDTLSEIPDCVDDTTSDDVVRIDNNTAETTDDDTIEQSCDYSLHNIKISYNPIVGRLIIDDGYLQTAVAVYKAISSIDLDSDIIPDDSDSLADLCSKIFYYIIACKHPAVIMSVDNFEIEFSMYAKLNFNRFVFFRNDDYVYAYIIDSQDVDTFYDTYHRIKTEDMPDNVSLMQYLIGTALVASEFDNRFLADDDDEVENVMEDRNDVKSLIALIDADPNTEYAGHNSSGDVLTRMMVIDYDAFKSDIVASINSFMDNYDDDDDEIDEDDDYNYTDDDNDDDSIDSVDVSSFPVDDDTPADINQMMDEISDDSDGADDYPVRIVRR